jgi:NAD(P)-dependent dehydrogenase (short-subunit alcohol dehydrogenase family)
MDLGLKGRACAVTGASRGIGRETARMLCAEGAGVLLVARSSDSLGEATEECASAGADAQGSAAPLVLDITDRDAGERIVAEAHERFGQLDVLVNNAGTARRRDLEHVPDEDWQAAWELNVMAPLRAMRAAVPGMVERGWGRIVNVSSSAGKRPSTETAEYSVAKAAELSLSRVFADRYAARGVLVNAICPGPTSSGLWMDAGGLADQAQERSQRSREEVLESVGAGRPVGRLADVAEIAGAIVFLCSERASYVAGAAWSVDGGSVQVII